LNSFFVEFRFHSYPKRYLRGLISEVAHRFRVKGAIKYRPVPHMTLYGPSQTAELQSVLSRIENVARKYALVPFSVCGFDWHHGKDGKVIAARINASHELKNLRKELAYELTKISIPQPWDSQGEYWFHTTIAFKDIDQKFDWIRRYLNEKEKPQINQYLVRITVLNSKREIEREYDLMFKKWLNRREALSKYWWQRTISRLRELQGMPPESPLSLMDQLKKLFRRLRW